MLNLITNNLSEKFCIDFSHLPIFDKDLDKGDDENGGRGFDQPLEAFGEPAIATDPVESAFDHPASGNDLETFTQRIP